MDGVSSAFVPGLVIVEPAGIIAVCMRWERAEDGAGIKARRRWLDGDSVSIIVLKLSPPPDNGCFLGANCRSLIVRRSSPFIDIELFDQWTCCFLFESRRDTDRGVSLWDNTARSSLPDSTYGPLYELNVDIEKKNEINCYRQFCSWKNIP